jgi:tetratricopeptide (TPR) repeat protein
MICASVGDHQRAIGLLESAVELLGGDLERERLGRALYPSVAARAALARSQAELGHFDSAKATLGAALGIAEALQHFTTLQATRLNACHVLLVRGDFRNAIPEVEACLEALRAAGSPTWSARAAAMLGYAYAMTGRLEEGIALLRDAVAQVAQGPRTTEAVVTTYLGEALLLARELGEAAALAERALALARERFERAIEARALWLLGEIAAQEPGGDRQAADRYYDDALSLAGELGLRPLVAHCHLGLGTLWRRAGDGQAGARHLATATEMFRKLGMSFWHEQASAEASEG